MRTTSIRTALLAVAAVAFASVAFAQVESGRPVQLKSKPRVLKFRGEVIHATAYQIVVRSRENEKLVRTFTYTPKVKEQIDRIIDRGGYQAGDKVEIQHEAGSDVAIKIKGKPSKPL